MRPEKSGTERTVLSIGLLESAVFACGRLQYASKDDRTHLKKAHTSPKNWILNPKELKSGPNALH